jgi:hypothetical protein
MTAWPAEPKLVPTCIWCDLVRLGWAWRREATRVAASNPVVEALETLFVPNQAGSTCCVLQIGGISVDNCWIHPCHPGPVDRLATNEVMVSVDNIATGTMPQLGQLLPLLRPPGTVIRKLEFSSSRLSINALLASQELATITSLQLNGCRCEDTIEAAVNTLAGQTPALADLTITQCTIRSLPPAVCALSMLSKLAVHGLHELPGGNYLAGELAFHAG